MASTAITASSTRRMRRVRRRAYVSCRPSRSRSVRRSDCSESMPPTRCDCGSLQPEPAGAIAPVPSGAQVRDDRALQRGPLRELVDVRRDPLEHESQDLGVTVGVPTDDPKASLEANDVRALVEVLRELIVEEPRVAHANAPRRFRKVRRKEFPGPAERRVARLGGERTAFWYVDAERGTSLESREIELEPTERVDHSAEVQRQPRTRPEPAVPEKAPVACEVASEIGEGRPGDVVRYAPQLVPGAHVAERSQEQVHVEKAPGRAERGR